jgi:hypothetical protein
VFFGIEDKVEAHQEKMDSNQEKMDATHSKGNENKPRTPERRYAGQVRCQSRKDDGQGGLQLEKMEPCTGKMEAMDLEVNPEEMESEAKHEEVPKEEATVKTSGALKEQYGDCHIAVRHHGPSLTHSLMELSLS